MRTTKTFTLLAVLAFIQMFFIQCAPKNSEPTTAPATETTAVATVATTASAPVCNIRIAYVDYDSLLLKFNLAQEMQKELIRKEMSINNIIEKERKTLQEEAAAFETKVQNNVFATQERAQAEYEKIMKKDQELLQRSQAMIAEFEKESITKSSEVTQSIMDYIKEYNSDAKFDFILTKMGGNMLYANEALDITDEVVKGLNAKHSVKE
ncbi:MAG: OmpH family outer membrane protein [Bacteroidaceae bacterium]|jgi:outer membrane protein|nr:OmpH family outer membrane protein [Bacteroidaceae bacterium]